VSPAGGQPPEVIILIWQSLVSKPFFFTYTETELLSSYFLATAAIENSTLSPGAIVFALVPSVNSNVVIVGGFAPVVDAVGVPAGVVAPPAAPAADVLPVFMFGQ